MAMSDPALSVRTVAAIADVPAAEWDACTGLANPFVSHDFLEALEASGSCTAETGWLPCHLLVEDSAGSLLAAVPLYLKGNSYGEYVFDWNWADAYERAGGRYYPKLQCSVPFTPATGPRLLVRPGPQAEMVRQVAIQGMLAAARQFNVSSLHVTFPPREEWQALGAAGFLLSTGHQYHWENRGYRDFDDFLAALSSRKRKAIRRERRDACAAGLRIRTLTGDDLTARHWDAFYRFYRSTTDRKWGSAYLTRGFFDELGQRMADRVALVVAEEDGALVAGALNLIGSDTLYGRNWGAIRDVPFLHFEMCYYRAMDFAIERGLARVEAGAQGEHKIQRGYLPVTTYSAHWIADSGFREAVAKFLAREREAVAAGIDELATFAPFRRTDAPG